MRRMLLINVLMIIFAYQMQAQLRYKMDSLYLIINPSYDWSDINVEIPDFIDGKPTHTFYPIAAVYGHLVNDTDSDYFACIGRANNFYLHFVFDYKGKHYEHPYALDMFASIPLGHATDTVTHTRLYYRIVPAHSEVMYNFTSVMFWYEYIGKNNEYVDKAYSIEQKNEELLNKALDVIPYMSLEVEMKEQEISDEELWKYIRKSREWRQFTSSESKDISPERYNFGINPAESDNDWYEEHPDLIVAKYYFSNN